MKTNESVSKFLSFVLRHKPESIHLNMDKNGWVDLAELISNAKEYADISLNLEIIKEIVDTNDKKRFLLDEENKRIRANQGHSIEVDLNLEQRIPPEILYHGTATRFLDSILENGLKPMSRQYVHLSSTEEIAKAVGVRHGRPVILIIDSKKMYNDGYLFYLSENKVWLVDKVPKEYLRLKDD